MSGLFHRASEFDQPLAKWNVSAVRDCIGMFFAADSFQQPIYDWQISEQCLLGAMFTEATAFHATYRTDEALATEGVRSYAIYRDVDAKTFRAYCTPKNLDVL
ncbi:unnamed protein product [Amoebophrya sp. A25]|nr:unnamed protein product [Amoebophrya sp. A25]|eukprot:GSA25T00027747001.1